MPALTVNDNSIGEALGLIGTAYSNAVNPKTQWEAYNLKQRVEHTQMLNQKLAADAALEAQKQAAINKAIGGVGQSVASTVAGMTPTIEQGRVDFNNQENQDFQGPFQGALPRVTNPGIARAQQMGDAAIASLRSGKDPAQVMRENLGFNMIAGGVPRSEQEAQLANAYSTGHLGDQRTPLTPGREQFFADRDQNYALQKDLNKGLSFSPGSATLVTTQQMADLTGQPIGSYVYGPVNVAGGTTQVDVAGNPRFTGPVAAKAGDVKNWSFTDPNSGELVTGRTLDGVTDITTKQPLPPNAQIHTTALQPNTVSGLQGSTISKFQQETMAAQETKALAKSLIVAIDKNPGSLGVPGAIQGIIQDLVASGDDVVKFAVQKAPREAADILTKIQSGVHKDLNPDWFNPSLGPIQLMLNTMAYRYAKMVTGSGDRISNQDFEQARNALGLHGFTANTLKAKANLQDVIRQSDESITRNSEYARRGNSIYGGATPGSGGQQDLDPTTPPPPGKKKVLIPRGDKPGQFHVLLEDIAPTGGQ